MAAEQSKRIYIGNLPYDFTTADLKTALQDLGLAPTDAHAMEDRETGRGRGFGFAEFADAAAAGTAIAAINQAGIGGRQGRADFAAPRPGGDGGGRRNDDRQGRGDRRR